MIFVHMLEIVALSDLASVLCARKFSFAPQGYVPQIAPFSFIIIIFLLLLFLKLREWPPLFYVFFLIWPPPRDLSIARLFCYVLLFKLSLLFKNGQ